MESLKLFLEILLPMNVVGLSRGHGNQNAGPGVGRLVPPPPLLKKFWKSV